MRWKASFFSASERKDASEDECGRYQKAKKENRMVQVPSMMNR
jgi:hypothetical protein